MFYKFTALHLIWTSSNKTHCLTSSSSSGGRCSSSQYPSLSSAFPRNVTAASLPEVSIASSLIPSSSSYSEFRPRQTMFPAQTCGMPELSEHRAQTGEGVDDSLQSSIQSVSQSVSRWSLRDARVQKTTPERSRQRAQHCAWIDRVHRGVVMVGRGGWGGGAGQCLRLSWLLHLHRNRRHTEGDYGLQFSESSPPGGGARAGREERSCCLHATVGSTPPSSEQSEWLIFIT